ncbi:alpha/beta hydrolase [Alloscardovia venturai]|uniref:Alpha/beta hydrolase n=1 Tax=Alloscardovia venturai TaxID=1769421 RepID=A0ABW2Y2L0_9BIFI
MAKNTIAKLVTAAAALTGAAWAFDKYAQHKFQRSGISLAINKLSELSPSRTAQDEMALLDEHKSAERPAGLPGIILKSGIADVYDDGNDQDFDTFGMVTYRFKPRDYSSATVHNVTVLYVHGGGYITGFDAYHVAFMTRLARQMGVTVIAPDYAPAPWGTAKDAYRSITALYTRYGILNPDEKVILMGDSAGAGLAFGLALTWAKQGLQAPEGIIAISPWVDVTLSNPDIHAYVDRDPMLDADRLRVDAHEWAGQWSMDDSRISPLKANSADIKALHKSEVTIIQGSDEIFFPDVTDFATRLTSAGVKTKLHIGEHMTHDYPLQPIPEAKESWSQIEMAIVEATVE